MEILHISTTDTRGGASRAALRIHQAQVEYGLDSTFFSNYKFSKLDSVHGPSKYFGPLGASVRSNLERLPLRHIFRNSENPSSLNWLPGSLVPRAMIDDSDIINLHFLGSATMPLSLAPVAKKPIVWTLHDMWPFSGVEHYSTENSCALWRTGEKEIKSWFDRLDAWSIKRKKKTWGNVDLTIVCPSEWLADCARNSWLFRDRRIEVIKNPIDLTVYRPIQKHIAKEMLGLSPTRKCILFGADPSNINSKRKGGDLLRNTLEQLGDLARESDILQLGGVRQQTKIGLFDCFHLGSYTDDLSLSVVYSAADCFVAPSRQDNLPNTVIESLACGTPIVAFKIGGMPDMIDSTVGRLARPFDTMDLAESIRSVLLPNNYDFGSACRRRAIQEFSQREISDAYRKLYLQILDSTSPK